jgi:hypothetical protein
MRNKDSKKEEIASKYSDEFVHDSAAKAWNYLTAINISTFGFILAITNTTIKTTPAKPLLGISIILMGFSLIFAFFGHMCLLYDLFNKKRKEIKGKLSFVLVFYWAFYVFGIYFFLWSISSAWRT